MTEHPILFSGEMIRAILAKRKTQTRRVIKEGRAAELRSYGVPGDRLRVHERQRILDIRHGRDCTDEGTCDILVCYEADNSEAWHEYPERLRWNPVVGKCLPRGGFRESSRLTLKLTGLRQERVQDITEADAILEGFDLETCESVFLRAAGKVEPRDACWLTHKDGDEYSDGGYWCTECAEKLADEHGLDISGNWETAHETDGPATCDLCYAPLFVSLTAEGIEREIFLEDPSSDDVQHYPVKGTDAATAAMITGGIGDLKERHHGRLAQIAFATYWDSLNLKRGYGWDANPRVIVRTFTPETQ